MILGLKNQNHNFCYILRASKLWKKLKKIRKTTEVIKIKNRSLRKSFFLLLKLVELSHLVETIEIETKMVVLSKI